MAHLKNLPTDKGMFFPELDNDTFRMPLTSPLLFRATRGIHPELSMEDLIVSLTKCKGVIIVVNRNDLSNLQTLSTHGTHETIRQVTVLAPGPRWGGVRYKRATPFENDCVHH
ncbi:hypothetical protein TNCV_25661 [Trichonephila clavipes]|uniref:Uncharacterized protein n=1 Tax=Trichonephila clavipes TaxID=2585209 RepID=A0A8X6W1N6_TRICX|nr:hypothetical protein TNCV_25661 [Trichonephila clavipes]